MNELDIVKKLIARSKCGRCSEHYEPDHIDLLGYHGDLWLFTAYCSSCKSMGLVVVNIKRDEESKEVTETVTETVTEPAEVGESHISLPVGSSDILDMHIFLKDFDGDFASLFAIYS